MAKLTIDPTIQAELDKQAAVFLRGKAAEFEQKAKVCRDEAERLDPLFDDEHPPAAGAPPPESSEPRVPRGRKPRQAAQEPATAPTSGVTSQGIVPTDEAILEALAAFDADNPVRLVDLCQQHEWDRTKSNVIVNRLITEGKIGKVGEKSQRRLYGAVSSEVDEYHTETTTVDAAAREQAEQDIEDELDEHGDGASAPGWL